MRCITVLSCVAFATNMHVALDGNIAVESASRVSPRLQTLTTLQQRASELMQSKLSPDAAKVVTDILIPTVKNDIVSSIHKEFQTAQSQLQGLVDALQGSTDRAVSGLKTAVSRDTTSVQCREIEKQKLIEYEQCEATKSSTCATKQQQCTDQLAAAKLKCEAAAAAAKVQPAKFCAPEECDFKENPTCGSADVQLQADAWLAEVRSKMETYQKLAEECSTVTSEASAACAESESYCAGDHCEGQRSAADQQHASCTESHESAVLAKCDFGRAAQTKCADLSAVHALIAKIKDSNRQDAWSEPDRVAEFAAVQRLLCLLQALHDEGDLSQEATAACAAKTPYPNTFDYFDERIAELTAADSISCNEDSFSFSGFEWNTGLTSAAFVKRTSNTAFSVDMASPPFEFCSDEVAVAIDLQVTNGAVVKSPQNTWGPYATCPEGYQVLGLGRIDMLGWAGNQNVNDFECNDNGCRAWCHNVECDVAARCGKASNLKLVNGNVVNHQQVNQWSEYSTCPSGYMPIGLAKIDLHGEDSDVNVNDFECNELGCRAWCESTTCSVTVRCAQATNLDVTVGTLGTTAPDQWSDKMPCPEGYVALSMARLDLHSNDEVANVGDMECTDEGCRAWCHNSDCSLRSMCGKTFHKDELHVTPGTVIKSPANQAGPSSTCPSGHKVVGLARLDMISGEHNANVNDFACDDYGCHAWCHNTECWVVARCARAPGLEATSGPLIHAPGNQWSEFSNCPSGYVAAGLGRVDIIGGENDDNVNDFDCNEKGCRVWCESTDCRVQPRCVKGPGFSVMMGATVEGNENTWSPVSECPTGSTSLSLSRIDIKGGGSAAQVNDLHCTNQGCRAWCHNTKCSVRSTCAKYDP
mmetsp:Transcript_38238/g.93625  ORF Transcript_38238/g.93625 Transcript_38238/m.93625 type:complete len:869 (+) Transcript_38238:96-2702(+)